MMKKVSWVEIRSSLIKRIEKQAKALQKQKKKTITLFFPSASDVRPLLGKQGLSAHSSYLGRQMFS